MPFGLLLQTVFIPIFSGILILLTRSRKGRHAGVFAVAALAYTTVLLCLAGIRLSRQDFILETFRLGPDVSLNLLADGLSLPIAVVINVICMALACYSLRYVDHRIEVIYPGADERTHALYYKRFFFLYLFFPVGFMGVTFSTNLITMYLFLELLTIVPLYFIMAQFGYSDFISRYKVALMCLFWGVAGATLFFIGILLGFNEISSFEINEFVQLSGNPKLF